MARVEDILQKMMRRFDSSDEQAKELRDNLVTIGQKVDAHAKKKGLSALTIPCTIDLLYFAKSLCDLSASINLMPLSIYKKLCLGHSKPTELWFMMADRIGKRIIRILHDVLMKVESFIFPTDFVIHKFEVDLEVPIIIGRLFLASGPALVAMEKWQMKFRLNNEEATLNVCRSIKRNGELKTVSSISYRVESTSEVQIEECLCVEALVAVIMKFESDGIEEYGYFVAALE
ncbi:uncharacterized protein LOC107006123 [Solanum pennellii]|uniref:Uncharacterized protein LOC107006123 n=1 Tax=Solanum pennellii TaxID=28526 RepID=A0ABM1FQK7_SOLPN|nr:uncharacterized protein LOC107006123 [Solanum pennellii]